MPRRVDPVLVLAGLVLLAALLLLASELEHRGVELSPDRASLVLTPGVTNPRVTQETIGVTICRHGWTRSIRPPSSFTSALKVEQMREYGRSGGPGDYQEDHLLSLELGGHPTDRRNLWPQPLRRAREVDRIEAVRAKVLDFMTLRAQEINYRTLERKTSVIATNGQLHDALLISSLGVGCQSNRLSILDVDCAFPVFTFDAETNLGNPEVHTVS